MRTLAALLIAGAAIAAHAAVAHGAGPARNALPAPIARPNPATFGLRIDDVAPLRAPDGTVADMPPLHPSVTAAAVADARFLHFLREDDLGGFVPAPVGTTALGDGGGRSIVGRGLQPELPLFDQVAGGRVQSFTFTGGPLPPPDNGKGPVPGLGNPPPSPVPTPGTTVPPPNDGFGGRPAPPPGGTTTTETTPTPPTTTTTPPPTTTRPPTTTTTTTTTATTTTTTTPTTTPAPPTTTTTPGGGGGQPSCGSADIAITGTPSACRIDAMNMAPGDSASEVLTITNTSGTAYTLSLKASGAHNALWDDLQLGVWEQGDPPPTPLPSLMSWTAAFNPLRTLAPGQSVTYVVQLHLPTSAGNDVQNLAAVIDFTWRATG